MTSFRPRYSLLSALLVMTIVGMVIVIVQLWREVGPLRAELIQRRAEMGHVFVTDPNKVHAIQARASGSVKRWRFYFPPQKMYQVYCFSGPLPLRGGQDTKEWLETIKQVYANTGRLAAGLPRPSQHGERTWDAAFVNRNDRWYLELSMGDYFPIFVRASSPHNLSGQNAWSDIRSDQQTVFDAGDPVLLMCLQGGADISPDVGTSTDRPTGEVDTIMLWIEEVP